MNAYAFPINSDVSGYLSTPPHTPEPTEAQIADRAKEVAAFWRRNDNRHYDKFYTAINDAVSSDTLVSHLFGLWLKGDTAELGNVLARTLTDGLDGMADQYARDEFAGVLGNLDERIPW